MKLLVDGSRSHPGTVKVSDEWGLRNRYARGLFDTVDMIQEVLVNDQWLPRVGVNLNDQGTADLVIYGSRYQNISNALLYHRFVGDQLIARSQQFLYRGEVVDVDSETWQMTGFPDLDDRETLPVGTTGLVALELANQGMFFRRPVKSIQFDEQGGMIEAIVNNSQPTGLRVRPETDDLYARFADLVRYPPEVAEELPLTWRCRLKAAGELEHKVATVEYDFYQTESRPGTSIEMGYFVEDKDTDRVMVAQLVGLRGDGSWRSTFSFIDEERGDVAMAYYLNGRRRPDIDISWTGEAPIPGIHYAAADLPAEVDSSRLFGWAMDQIAAENPARPRPREFEVER